MDRRNFLKTAGAAALGAAVYPVYAGDKPPSLEPDTILKPPALKEGDTVGLISPAGNINKENLEEAEKNLTDLGFKVKPGKHVLEQNGYFAGTDVERAEDFNSMFWDPEVKGVVTARGGYGCARILDLIDYNVVRENPKIVIGYSDITSLQYALYSKTGLISFHGPVGISTYDEYSIDYFKKILMQPDNEEVILKNAKLPEKRADEFNRYVITPGKAEGRLAGGNLSVAVTLIGTQYDIDYSGKIVFLEDVREEPYSIDRMLTQMIMSGKFENAAGIVLGVFRNCESERYSKEYSFTLSEVLEERLAALGIPVTYGVSFGHINSKFTLPFGGMALLNTEEDIFKLTEPAVV